MAIKPLDAHVVNVLTVYARADSEDRQQGCDAYLKYHRTMLDILRKSDAPMTDENLRKLCGIFSALSPNATYSSNLVSAKAMWKAYVDGRDIDSFSVSTYNQNKRKAWNILTSLHSVEYWIRAKKTLAFYKNIYDPFGERDHVVVDGHMYSVWMLKKFGMREAQVGNNRQYDRIAADISTAARVVGIRPAIMQTTCWFTWKRIHRIAFDTRELQRKILWTEVGE